MLTFSLLIDTSTERGFAVFFENHKILFQGHFPFGLNSSQHLLPEINRGFSILGKTTQDLDFVAVGIGPGSYTGMRVAAITAKTLAFALDKPLVVFCSLEAFLPAQEGTFAVILDAKIGGVYLLKGERQKDILKMAEHPQMVSLNSLGATLKDIKILVSPNISAIKKKIEELYPENSWVWEEAQPHLEHLNHLTATKFAKKEFSDARYMDMLYLRKTQAEIEKNGFLH